MGSGGQGFWDRYRRAAPEVAGRAVGVGAGVMGAATAPWAGTLAGAGMGAGGIYDWLKQQAMGLNAPGGSPYGPTMPMGPGMMGQPMGPSGPAVGPTPAAPAGPTPGRAFGPSGVPYAKPPWDVSRGFEQVTPGGADAGAETPVPFLPGAETKTEQRAPLQFSWGSATPEDYEAGITDILQMEGAPTARGGFMGAPPVAGGMEAGGFGPSQTDWSKVANPMGFEAFREQPAIEEQRRYMEDPLWRERAAAEIQEERDVGIGSGIAQAQADIVKAQQEEKLDQYLDIVVAQAQDERRSKNEPPMTPEEVQQFRETQRAAMLAGAYTGAGGMGGMMIR